MQKKNLSGKLHKWIIDHNRVLVNIVIPVSCLIFLLIVGLGSVPKLADTNDEKFHLTRGVMLLNTGDLRINQHHPYLFNLISAIPTLFDPTIDIPREQAKAWKEANKDELSFQFVDINGGREGFSRQTLYFPRVFTFLISLVLLAFSYFLTIRVFGPIAAIIFLIFTTTSATVVAHSTLVTTDMASMLLIYLICVVIYHKISTWEKDETFNLKTLAGLSFLMVLMLLSKYTAVVVIIPLMLMMFWHGYKQNGKKKQKLINKIWNGFKPVAITTILILLFLTAAYKFQFAPMVDMAYGNQEKIDSHLASMDDLRNWNQKAGDLAEYVFLNVPLPFPQYVNGFYENVIKHNAYGHRSFFMGEFSNGGWPLYFPTAFVLKEPTGTLLLVGCSILVAIGYFYKIRPKINIDLMLLFLIPAILGYFSITSSINLGIRHILPLFPFIFLAIGLLVDRIINKKNYLVILSLIAIFALFNILSLVNAYPHYIPYFNFLAGGSENGYKYLRDSNFDWDQSLLYQLEYIDTNTDKKITLDPNYIYGFDYIIIGKEMLYGDPEKTKDIPNIEILKENIKDGDAKIIKDIAVVDLLIRVSPYEWEKEKSSE